jgi:hypothetical protein
MQWCGLQISLNSQCTENTVDRYIPMVFWMECDDDQLRRVPCRRTVILKQMAEVGSAVVYKTARRNVSDINFGWMPNASFKRRKKGCQIRQYGVCLALLDETFCHELIAWCEMHIWSNLCNMILHPHESVDRFELLGTSKGERQCWEMLLPRMMLIQLCSGWKWWWTVSEIETSCSQWEGSVGLSFFLLGLPGEVVVFCLFPMCSLKGLW